MPGARDPGSYVEDMVAACEHIVVMTAEVPDADVLDRVGALYGDVLYQLAVLGEATKHLPQDTRERHPDIPWSAMAGMRDVIVHYYFGLDDLVVLDAVRRGVPRALPCLRVMLAELDGP